MAAFVPIPIQNGPLSPLTAQQSPSMDGALRLRQGTDLLIVSRDSAAAVAAVLLGYALTGRVAAPCEGPEAR